MSSTVSPLRDPDTFDDESEESITVEEALTRAPDTRATIHAVSPPKRATQVLVYNDPDMQKIEDCITMAVAASQKSAPHVVGDMRRGPRPDPACELLWRAGMATVI